MGVSAEDLEAIQMWRRPCRKHSAWPGPPREELDLDLNSGVDGVMVGILPTHHA